MVDGVGPAGCLLTLNNRKHFSGVWEVNSYFKLMRVVVRSLVFKRHFGDFHNLTKRLR